VEGFQLSIHQLAPQVLSVRLAGDLDLDVAYTFDAEMRRIEGESPQTIVLDLRGLNFMDSSGLARVLAVDRRGRRAGRRVCVVRGPAPIQRILAFAAVDRIIDLIGDPLDALPETA